MHAVDGFQIVDLIDLGDPLLHARWETWGYEALSGKGKISRARGYSSRYRGVPIPRLGDTVNPIVLPFAVGFWNWGSP